MWLNESSKTREVKVFYLQRNVVEPLLTVTALIGHPA